MTDVGQADFGAGIWRYLDGPPGTVYDAVEAIVDGTDLLRRGGTDYLNSPVDANSMVGVSYLQLAGPARTTTWNATNFFALDSADALVAIPLPSGFGSLVPTPLARPAGIGKLAVFPTATPGVFLLYGGSWTTSTGYSTGTVAVTHASTTITGTGTSWLANVFPGMILLVGSIAMVVSSVESNTALTVSSPWPGSTVSGQSYGATPTLVAISRPGSIVAAVGSPPRLLMCYGTRVSFSAPGTYQTGDINDFHEMPPDSTIIGADSIRDNAVIFTTAGAYVISNMAYDLTDDAGNPQQQLAQVNKDIVLWGNQGISGWHGALVVPAVDDVYLMALDGSSESIGRGIVPLYRSYVRAGFIPGGATLYRGHYLLPILEPTGILATPYTVRDLLVCRLDQGRSAWTRWGGERTYAMTQRVVGSKPQLIGTSGPRLADFSDCFEPRDRQELDANGEAFALDVTTHDFDTGPGNRNTVRRLQARYILADGPLVGAPASSVRLSYIVGPEGAAEVVIGSGDVSDGVDPVSWRLAKRTRRLRLRVLSSGGSPKLRLRSLVLTVRPSNRP